MTFLSLLIVLQLSSVSIKLSQANTELLLYIYLAMARVKYKWQNAVTYHKIELKTDMEENYNGCKVSYRAYHNILTQMCHFAHCNTM